MLCVALSLPMMGFSPSSLALAASSTTSRGAVRMKKVEQDEDRNDLPNIAAGSICEFHDPKHGAGNAPPVLGVVESVEFKTKGGARIILKDESGTTHTVAEKMLHIVLPPHKGKETEPKEILKDFAAVMSTPVTEFVDPELVELAWTECLENEGTAAYTPKKILSLIDDALVKTPLQMYQAFRVVSSDFGKIFFKALGDNKYKPKAAKAVSASKENYCRSPQLTSEEWCFV